MTAGMGATGTCPACGVIVRLINYSPPRVVNGRTRLPAGGYLGGHHRRGTRLGTRCRGSFGTWVERDTQR
jgi:hypothetical protein